MTILSDGTALASGARNVHSVVRHAYPETFDAIRIFGDKFPQVDGANWLISRITLKASRKDVDQVEDAVPLNSEYLRLGMGRRVADDVVAGLLDANEIGRTDGYLSGERSRLYWLQPKHATAKRIRRPAVVNPFALDRQRRWRHDWEKKKRATLRPIHMKLWAALAGCAIDPKTAREVIDNLPNDGTLVAGVPVHAARHISQNDLVAQVASGDFIPSVSEHGRFYTPFCSLAKPVRALVRIDDEPHVMFDISASQPTLIPLLARHENTPLSGCKALQHIWDGVLPCTSLAPTGCFSVLGNSPIAGGPGWEFYEDRCRHGDFYETLLEEAKAQGSRLDRDGVKRAFLRDVVAKKGNYASVVEEATGRLFPDPWAFVKRVNRGDHRRLIHALNQVESWLVLENICTNFMRLAPRSSFFTVHDSLAVAESKAHLAERAFADTFDRLGIAGNFKSKGFTSP